MRRWPHRILATTLVAASLLVPTESAQAADGPGSNPRELVRAGDTMFFTADDGTHGYELWKSDGTEEGTSMVRDIVPDSGSSATNNIDLTAVGSNVFFVADDGVHGVALWKSDGSEGGTELVKYSDTSSQFSCCLNGLIAVGTTLFFEASDGIHGWELWKSDGTPEGTSMVKDINDGAGDGALSGDESFAPARVGSTLYFVATDGTNGYKLWKSDGTPDGTKMVEKSSGSGGTFPYFLTRVQGRLFFEAGAGLWVSDGTPAGTHLVKDVFGSGLAPFGSRLLFGGPGAELWKSDGTADGTHLIKDIYPNGHGMRGTPMSLGKIAVFHGFNRAHGDSLWRTNGTAQGTVLVKKEVGTFSRLKGVGVLYAGEPSGDEAPTLWESNGWPGGTAQVMDFAPGSVSSSPSRMASLGTKTLFAADDGIHGWELWITDGTPGGTHLVKDINP